MRRQFGLWASVLTGAVGLGAAFAPVASATPAEQNFFSQVYLYAHPSVTDARLLDLGYQVCRTRRSGQSTDAAEAAMWKSLNSQGVVASNAETGSLVHVAIDTLCPEVGYPDGNATAVTNGPSSIAPPTVSAPPTRSAGNTFVDILQQQYGITMDSDAADDMAKTACSAPIMGVGLYNAEVAMQQRYPRYDLNTVSRVMGAGVVTYCPGRLP